MLKSGLLYVYNDVVVNFFEDHLVVYNDRLKKEQKLNIFADIVSTAFNKIAILKNNCIEIKNS